ncbi:MAG: TonB-dependent receptor, partial [Chthoniobacterales bacterium]
DKWKIRPNLTVTGGLRIDTHVFPDDPLYNPKFAADFPGRSTSQIEGDVIFSPRLGFNWDVFNNKSTQVRGGAGIFGGRTLGVLYTNQYGGTGIDFKRVSQNFGGTGNPPLTPGFFTGNPDNPPVPPAGRVLAPEIDLTDTDFEAGQLARTSLGIDQKLPFGVIGTLEALYSKTLVGVNFKNLNLAPQIGVRPEDGRPIYGGFNADKNFDRVILLTNTSRGYSYNLTAQLERPNAGDGWYAKAAYTYGRAKDVNSSTSSQAASNYGFAVTRGNPNSEEDHYGTSAFELRHRIIAALSYTFAFRKGWDTTAGLFYEGAAGKPYSVIYNGDANGDGQFSNDLIYVPTGTGDPIGAKFVSAANFAAYNHYIDNNNFLSHHRGEIAPRNGGRDPWINRMDLHFSQKIPVKWVDVEATVDILNVLNLVDDSRGQIKRYSTFGTPQPVALNSTTGVYTFNDGTGTSPTVQSFDDLESRWRIQLGLRVTF